MANFKNRKRGWLLPALILIIVILSSALQASAADYDGDDVDDADYSSDADLTSTSAPKNCFSTVNESTWSNILTLDRRSGILDVRLNNSGRQFLTCVEGKLMIESGSIRRELLLDGNTFHPSQVVLAVKIFLLSNKNTTGHIRDLQLILAPLIARYRQE